MAGPKGSAAPASVAEGLNGIAQAVTAAMTAPDAAPYMKQLMTMQGAIVGMIHKAAGGAPMAPPGAAPGPPPGAAPGGGAAPNFGISALGGAPAGPSAAAAGGPGAGSLGMDADAIRQLTAASS